jgi:hypothetical protein
VLNGCWGSTAKGRKKMKRVSIVGLALSLILCASSPPAVAAAQTLQGSLKGAPYTIEVPDNWNGTLVVYAHGYRDKADHPGQTDDRSAPVMLTNPFWFPDDTSAETLLLNAGYALAGTAYKSNGFAVEDGLDDVPALTRFFTRKVSKPQRTILFGSDIGSIIAFRLMEKQQGPRLFDGAIAACNFGAGGPMFLDYLLDYSLAFAAGFMDKGGYPQEWGRTFDYPLLQTGNGLETIDYANVGQPLLLSRLGVQTNFPAFEFQRIVSNVSVENYYPFDTTGSDIVLFMLTQWATEFRGELIQRAGGQVSQNLDHVYRMDENLQAFLISMGYDPEFPLKYMDDNRIAADPVARQYLRELSEYTGNIRGPVLTFHTQDDGLASATGNTVYKTINERAGKRKLLRQVYTTNSGHCNFAQRQILFAVQAMDSWVKTGIKPSESFFPEVEGFRPLSFDPGPWPYPRVP